MPLCSHLQPSTTPSNTASPSASSQYNTGCPSSFGITHYVNAQSITAANDTTAFLRHCGFWWYMLKNFPVLSATDVKDATHILRLGQDGTPNSVSFQSSNYQAYYLMVTPDSYFQYTDFTAITASGPTAANAAMRANATWDIHYNADGSFNLTSHATGMYGLNFNMEVGTANAHACTNTPNSANIRAFQNPYNSLSSWRFYAAGPLAAGSAYTTPATYQSIVLESMQYGFGGGTLAYACGNGAAYVANAPLIPWNNISANWIMMPPLACPSVCGYQTFSLQAGIDPTGIT